MSRRPLENVNSEYVHVFWDVSQVAVQLLVSGMPLPNFFQTARSILWPSWLGRLNTPTASLQRGKTSPTNILDMTKQSDQEALVMLELCGMQTSSPLPLYETLFWPGVVAPNRDLSTGQKELNCALILNWNF